MRNPAKQAAKTIDQVVRGILRDGPSAQIFLLVFTMKKHGKGLTSQDFFMEDSKGVLQTEALVELRNKSTK